MLALILANVATFLASTNETFNAKYEHVLNLVEAVTSCLFLLDYILRIMTITEQRFYGRRGPLWGRLSWIVSAIGLVDGLSTLPYFIDVLLLKNKLPSFTWIRIFRIFLLFKTGKYAHAVNTVYRVLWVNSEILGVSTILLVFMLLFTSALLWVTASDSERAANGIIDAPSAMYLALLMLTGQGTPDGDLGFVTKCVVMLTALLSVPICIVPCSMLTWGFEGEAERLAQQHRKRRAREQLYGSELGNVVSSSSSEDEGSNLEDYLDLLGGADDDDAAELEGRALAFFESAAEGVPLLPEARKLAEELEAQRSKARRRKQLQADALTLLGQAGSAPDEDQQDWEEKTERRLQMFKAQIAREPGWPIRPIEQAPPRDPQASFGSSEKSLNEASSVERELRALRTELSALRREIAAR